MRIVAILALAFLLAGCTQNSPAPDAADYGSCPSWVKGLNGERVSWSLNFLYTNQSTSAPLIDDWDLREPTFDEQGNVVKAGAGFGDSFTEFQGHPLDQLVFDFTSRGTGSNRTGLLVHDAELHLSFLASYDGQPGETLTAYEQGQGPASGRKEWVFRSEPAGGTWFNKTLRIDLANAGDQPDPRGVFVYWSWVFDLDHDIDTPSYVARGYAPEFWYRTCSRDGTRL